MYARHAPAPDDLEGLLLAARRGGGGALEDLYRRYAPSVTGYLRGAGAREPDDLTSETFVGMIRGLRRFHGDETDFRAWLFTIARRRLQDERRRAAHRLQAPVAPEDLRDMLPPEPDAEAPALERLGSSEVLGLLEDLTPEQRDVILLRVVADLPVARVARILGKGQGAVKMLQRRALARLRAAIGRSPLAPVT